MGAFVRVATGGGSDLEVEGLRSSDQVTASGDKIVASQRKCCAEHSVPDIQGSDTEWSTAS